MSLIIYVAHGDTYTLRIELLFSGIVILDKLCTIEQPDFAYFVSKGRRRHMAVLQNDDFFL